MVDWAKCLYTFGPYSMILFEGDIEIDESLLEGKLNFTKWNQKVIAYGNG